MKCWTIVIITNFNVAFIVFAANGHIGITTVYFDSITIIIVFNDYITIIVLIPYS
jgi:hypothetical protein